ncbi:MAG: sugar phosphate isomerase/epimerase [Ornithinimicrobium sp.]
MAVDSPHPKIPIHLSTSSVYPQGPGYCFDLAERLGYDGVEVMVWSDEVTQEAKPLIALSHLHGLPIGAIHAPTLLLSQRLWGWDPWGKIDRSLELARDVGAPVVVVHPPFRWQRRYADTFIEGVARRERDSGITIAVENMFPWRVGRADLQAYLPAHDPTDLPYEHLTFDVSHAGTAGSDALLMVQQLGPRVAHLHLGDSFGTFKDEHLVPGRGVQRCAEVLQHLVHTDFGGVVSLEVSTRKAERAQRELDLEESLAFARTHLRAPSVTSGP